MNLHYAKNEVQRSRDAASPHSWPRRIAEDWLELMAEIERLQPIVDQRCEHCAVVEDAYDRGFKAGRKAEGEEAERLKSENRQLLDLSRGLNEHPDDYDGPCLCQLCLSYAGEAAKAKGG